MKYSAAIAYCAYLVFAAFLVGCAAGPGTHKEGYYIVMNDDPNNRMCCTPDGVAAAKSAIDRHDERAARAILFHTNPEQRSLGWMTMNGTKYYAYSSHLYQGDTDSMMAQRWQEFNRAFGYDAVPWLPTKIEKQRIEAERYWKDSTAALQADSDSRQGQSEASSPASLVLPSTPVPDPPLSGRSSPVGNGGGVCTSKRSDFVGYCKDICAKSGRRAVRDPNYPICRSSEVACDCR